MKRGSSATTSRRSGSASMQVERGQPQAREVRHRAQDALQEPAEPHPVRPGVGGRVDAGQHRLGGAGLDGGPHGLDHPRGRRRARGAAAEGDDAEGAAVVAAVLPLRRRPACGRPLRPGGDAGGAGTRARPRPGARRRLAGIGQDARHLGHGAQRGVDLGGAGPSARSRPRAAPGRRGGPAWRAWRTASDVTAQEFTTTRSRWPAASAAARIASDSTMLSRQPKLSTSTPAPPPLTTARRRPSRGRGGRGAPAPPGRSSGQGPSSRQRMSSVPPGRATRGVPAREAAARRRHQRGAGGRAAGQRRPGAPLPDAQQDVVGAPAPRRRTRCSGPGTGDAARSAAPARRGRSPPRRGRRKRQCGLPMPTAAGASSPVPARAGPRSSRSVSADAASGMSRQPSRGAPMSTVKASGPSRRHATAVPETSRRRSSPPPVSAMNQATQRVPLPQAPADGSRPC